LTLLGDMSVPARVWQFTQEGTGIYPVLDAERL